MKDIGMLCIYPPHHLETTLDNTSINKVRLMDRRRGESGRSSSERVRWVGECLGESEHRNGECLGESEGNKLASDIENW